MKNIRVVNINIGSPTPQQTELRKESARLWNRLVKLHKYNRKRHWKWLGKFDLSSHFKGRFDLHSQSIQALCEKLSANVDTTRTNRKNGDHKARYPWRCKKNFQVCIWKQAAIHIKGNRISLSNGRGRKPLRFKLPRTMPMGKIVQAELGFRELRLTISNEIDKPSSAGLNTVAADVGIIHTAVMTDGVKSLGIVGRGMRSLTQGKNRKLAFYTQALSKCKKGSRKSRKLRIAKAKMLNRYENRTHNLLHHVVNQMLDFCVSSEAGTLIVGDIANIAKNKKKKQSKRSNQENSQTPIGRLYDYLRYKGQLRGVEIVKISEAYTSQTCPLCGHRHKPSGRIYKCTNKTCDFVGIRDNVGAANILNKHYNGKIVAGTLLPPSNVKYLRPVKLKQSVVDLLNRGKLLSITHTKVTVSEEAGSKIRCDYDTGFDLETHTL